MPNPIDNPELYDSVIFAGERSPGMGTLSGHDREIGWDVKKAAGQKGASMERTSEDPVKFKLTVYLADAEEFEAWQRFESLIESTVNGPVPKAADIYHPDLASRGIKSVVEAKLYGIVYDGLGGGTAAVDFLEYLPPKPKGGSPKGSTTKTSRAPDPNQDLLDELDRLTNQYQNTPWG